MKARPTTDRRTLLKAVGLAALGAGFGVACGARRLPGASSWAPRGPRRLAMVEASPERVIRTVVGLRPFRPSGFVVRSERLAGKVVIHNYGHGGGGVTLSWGTAHLALEEALSIDETSCAVIGCGAVGLATARLLQRHGRQVTIYAKDLPPETTSNIAGAQWSPTSVADAEALTPTFKTQLKRAAELAYRHFQDLVGEHYGVRWVENYFLGHRPIGMPQFFQDLRELYPDVRELAPHEHPFGTSHAVRLATMLVEPPVYLEALLRDYLLAGGRIVVREFKDLQSVLALTEPVILNCTGLGARALFGDEGLTPVKGQLTVLLPQPEIDYITVGPDGLYMIPRRDGILLGGTFERGVWTLEPNAAEAQRIMEGHRRLFGRGSRAADLRSP